jgi:hypothetical protein
VYTCFAYHFNNCPHPTTFSFFKKEHRLGFIETKDGIERVLRGRLGGVFPEKSFPGISRLSSTPSFLCSFPQLARLPSCLEVLHPWPASHPAAEDTKETQGDWFKLLESEKYQTHQDELGNKAIHDILLEES